MNASIQCRFIVASCCFCYALVKRFAKNPTRMYLIIAVIALFISLIPNVQLIRNPTSTGFLSGTVTAAWVLVAFHVVAAIVSVTMLLTLSASAKRSSNP
jgi:hypothetical protein